MRKQDRIRQQQNRPEDQMNPSPQMPQQEQGKGTTPGEQQEKPERQSGKLPLPD